MPQTQPVVVHSKQTPLAQVLCQVSFPNILKNSLQLAAKFQSHIHTQFPYASLTANQKSSNYFAKDRLSHLTLAPQSLSLVTSRYGGWESVRDQFWVPVNALVQEYDLPFIVRVRLRFSHVIRRARLGLGNHEWNELLKSKAANAGGWDEVSQNMHGSRTEVVMALDDPSQRLRVIHGVVNVNGETDEQAYLLDHDFFSEKEMSIEEVFANLDTFHVEASVLLQGWTSKIIPSGKL